MKKMNFAMFGFIMLLTFTACKKDVLSDETILTKKESSSVVTKSATPTSTCSYPQAGVSLGSFSNTQELGVSGQTKKYYVKTSTQGKHFFCTKVTGSGTVVVRSVLEDNPLFSGATYSVKDWCMQLSSGGDAVDFGPSYWSSPWDNIYYEVIVSDKAVVNWTLY